MFCYINTRFLSGIFISVLLSGCATAPQTLKLAESPPLGVRHQVELNQVTFFSQHEFQCGPAALATMLDYQGVIVTPDDLIDKVYIPQRKGSLQLEMIATARSYGLLSYQLEPKLSALVKEINQGNPVLVFQNLSLEYWPQWHYAVVIGYDLNKSELILHSGTIPRYKISFSTFERTWERAKYWAYVLLRAGDIPATAKPVNYTQASHDLHKSGYKNHALNAFRQAAKKWPDKSIALMALANAEFMAGNYENAISVFKRELKLRKNNETAWNNLAYALAAKNCIAEATKAIICANNLSPNDLNIQKSLLEITKMPDVNEGTCGKISCPKI